MAPGAKFSTMTSARFAMFLTRSSPRSDLRLTVMDFLLALNNRKYQESWFGLWLGPDCRPNKERPASPPCGFSTLTTSAPSPASASVQDGPASNWVRFRTRTTGGRPDRHAFQWGSAEDLRGSQKGEARLRISCSSFTVRPGMFSHAQKLTTDKRINSVDRVGDDLCRL